jgi:hypothetical protein
MVLAVHDRRGAMSRLSEKLRYGSLGALLVLTLFAAAVPGEPERRDSPRADAGSRPRPAPEARAPETAPLPADAGQLRREALAEPMGNPFSRRSWATARRPAPPAAPEPLAVSPPPAPTAPPLPFSYMGRLLEEPSQRPVYFLVEGDRLHTVAQGDVINGTYRLEGVEAGRLAITYMPLNVRQFLPLGSGS